MKNNWLQKFLRTLMLASVLITSCKKEDENTPIHLTPETYENNSGANVFIFSDETGQRPPLTIYVSPNEGDSLINDTSITTHPKDSTYTQQTFVPNPILDQPYRLFLSQIASGTDTLYLWQIFHPDFGLGYRLGSYPKTDENKNQKYPADDFYLYITDSASLKTPTQLFFSWEIMIDPEANERVLYQKYNDELTELARYTNPNIAAPTGAYSIWSGENVETLHTVTYTVSDTTFTTRVEHFVSGATVTFSNPSPGDQYKINDGEWLDLPNTGIKTINLEPGDRLSIRYDDGQGGVQTVMNFFEVPPATPKLQKRLPLENPLENWKPNVGALQDTSPVIPQGAKIRGL